MIYVRMNKQRAWHIPKFGIAGADALCGVESPGLFRGWNQERKSLLARHGLCLRCGVAYEQWRASDRSWPVPYTCDYCGAQEDMARLECDSCHRKACGKCAVDFTVEFHEVDDEREGITVGHCPECYKESSKSGT